MNKFVFMIAALVIAFTGTARAEDGRISVSGTGSSVAVPDMAQITLGVRHEAETAQSAMDLTSAAMEKVVARLSQAGIEPRDLQTQNISLSPVWTNARDNETGQNRRVLSGYAASNMVSVRVRNLETLGDVLAAATADGSNEMRGLSFSVSDPEPLLADARQKAVRDARAKAEQLADAAGVSLGRLVSLDEHGGPVRPVSARASFDAEAAAVPIQSGEVGYDVSVSMVYAIAE